MTTKYRPYFTLSELKHLAGLCRLDSPTSSLSKYLDRYILDIESGYRKENTKIMLSLAARLGFEEPNPENIPAIDTEKQKRYDAGLMSPQEMAEYEKSQGVIFK